jgi:hypothetical protein
MRQLSHKPCGLIPMSIAYLPFDNYNDVLEAPRSGLTDAIFKVWNFIWMLVSVPLIREAVIGVYRRIHVVADFANFVINVCQPLTSVVGRRRDRRSRIWISNILILIHIHILRAGLARHDPKHHRQN